MKIDTVRYICLISVLLVLIIALYPVEDTFAVFSLSATPYEGGYDLRFGKVSSTMGWVNEEVNVNISSDILKQYRLIQRLVKPLTNEQGYDIPIDSFRVYGLRGSNKYGTLSVENEIPEATLYRVGAE